MTRRIVAIAAIAVAIVATACSGSASPATATPSAATRAAGATPTVAPVSFPSAELHVATPTGDRALRIEVATTVTQLERGLGYRDALASDAGMLFDLGGTRPAQFWMKGMRFALDFVWITEDKRVAGITPNVPPEVGVPDAQLTLYPSPEPVRYVLEINAGASAVLGISMGTQLSFQSPE